MSHRQHQPIPAPAFTPNRSALHTLMTPAYPATSVNLCSPAALPSDSRSALTPSKRLFAFLPGQLHAPCDL